MNINALDNFFEFSVVALTNDTFDVTVLSRFSYEYKSNAPTIEEAIEDILTQIEAETPGLPFAE